MPDRRRAWSRALFDAAPDAAGRSDYGAALEGLASFYATEPRFREFLRDPAVSKEDKSALLAAALGPSAEGGSRSAEVPETFAVFRRFCDLLVEKGRTGLLPAIAVVYRVLLDAEEGVARLVLEAAREPDPAIVRRIAGAWALARGARRAETEIRILPELIGGYRLRSGSVRYDYSVAGRLERLRRELARPLGPARGEG